jgi:Uma2 family endonuclease
MVEAFTITDPRLIRCLKHRREATQLARKDEMWEGIYVVSPDPNNEHHLLASELMAVFLVVRHLVGGGVVFGGGNISDRVEGWTKNYRIPDVAVYLATNPARNCGTHWCGGPDLAVEILSEGDLARKKLAFYAKVGTREVVIIDRDTWALELYRLTDGRLELVGISTPDRPDSLASEVLPLSFRLVPGEGRPTLELTQLDGGQTWRI